MRKFLLRSHLASGRRRRLLGVAVCGLTLLAAQAGCFGLRPPLAADDSPSPFFVAPYLVTVGSEAIEIRWWPREAFRIPQLRFSTKDAPPKILEAREQDGVLSVPLPWRCADGTQRHYQVAGLETPRPLLLPPCPVVGTARFALWSDTQEDGKYLLGAAEIIAAFEPDFVLHGGDMVDRGSSEQQWVEVLDATGRFGHRAVTVATLGNHERYYHRDFREFRRFFGDDERTWFRFSAGPVDVIVLDSEQSDEQLHGEQRQWLEETLAALAAAPEADHRWRLVLTHHSPLSSGLANAPYVRFGGSRRLRSDYLPLFESYGVDLVLSGHTHVYERLEQRGITYLVSGTVSGFMGLMSDDHPASLFVAKARTVTTFEADSESLTLRTREIGGEIIDEHRLLRR